MRPFIIFKLANSQKLSIKKKPAGWPFRQADRCGQTVIDCPISRRV